MTPPSHPLVGFIGDTVGILRLAAADDDGILFVDDFDDLDDEDPVAVDSKEWSKLETMLDNELKVVSSDTDLTSDEGDEIPDATAENESGVVGNCVVVDDTSGVRGRGGGVVEVLEEEAEGVEVSGEGGGRFNLAVLVWFALLEDLTESKFCPRRQQEAEESDDDDEDLEEDDDDLFFSFFSGNDRQISSSFFLSAFSPFLFEDEDEEFDSAKLSHRARSLKRL
jgi:hypothetical protein